MKDCEKCRNLFVEALYGELELNEKSSFENHIGSCPACAAELKGLSETLKTMDLRERPEPGQKFWDGYWDRLAGRVGEETAAEITSRSWGRKLRRIWSLSPRWAFQTAAAFALIVAGIWIGRTVFAPHRVPVETSRRVMPARSVKPAEGNAVLRAQNFVDRSKLLFLALVNYDPKTEDPYALNLPYQKQVSQELVAQAGVLKSDLNKPGQRRLRELVADLETILLQIANLETRNDLEAVEFVKQGVENRGIFLKINLSEMGGDLSRGGREPAAEESPSQKIKI